ncbi:hypothetical protein GCM10007972_23450 [Iodidimonas muriae]|uniref:Uncharacterized protein n=1 Tax=Iodidimonas muriae TaxID=261467 RepID=A0ABQ2LF99_9PROT|nr:hypothetical protein JCM17843_27920 [Kordiimonadales bacterium JCM 17843]GGO15393.1 hypothetical protein GCM10007972_23450 [Iodidimonas muriae]
MKHIHRDENGRPEQLSFYGGMATSNGTEWRQEFPADAYSKEIFAAAGLEQSLQNIWSLEIGEQEFFAYALTRPEYKVRVAFDLKNPISPLPSIPN